MSKKNTAILASAVFCTSASMGESSKIDCKNIFTSFLAWSYPTSIRNWYAILTIYSLPEAQTTINISISKGRGKKAVLGSAIIKRGKIDLGTVINIPLAYKFPNEGMYTVHFNAVGSTSSLKIPLLIATKPWPRITKREREFLKDSPSVPHSIRMNVHCSGCSRPYMFEENVLKEEKLAEGVLSFPKSGELQCGTCSHTLHMKDIEGQLRNSIKAAATAAMRGGK